MTSTSAPKQVSICKQVLTSGHYCKCPALRNGDFCYYHNRDRQRRRIFERSQEIQRGYDQHRESRTEDEFNHEVVFSLQLPALDDKASIHVACTNLLRALYCDHISVAKARVMMRAIAEANLSLRRGDVLNDYKQPVLECDPDPIENLGHSDPDGCVLPEERGRKEAIVIGRREAAARADAEIAAARARGENPPPRPLTPEEEKAAALEARRAETDAQLLHFWQGALKVAEPGSIQYAHAEHELAATESRIAARDTRKSRAGTNRTPQPVILSEPLVGESKDPDPPSGAPHPGTARVHPCEHLPNPCSIPNEVRNPSSPRSPTKGMESQASPLRPSSPGDSSANNGPQNDADIEGTPEVGGAYAGSTHGGSTPLQRGESPTIKIGASAPGSSSASPRLRVEKRIHPGPAPRGFFGQKRASE